LYERESEDFVVQADKQTSGKGRKNRSWESPPGNLYFSLCTEKTSLLPLRASVAVAQSLEDIGISPSLKWPNDVIVDEKKICGILTEVIDGNGIIGIGLNVRSAPIEGSICISDLLDTEVSLDQLMKEILSNFYDIKDVLKTYRNYSSTLGEKVKIKTVNGDFKGIVADIDEKGRLVLESGKKFISGDVIHLREDTI